ncbi:class I SAM-dependent methyltransferase [Fimbriiglobus ruber]|uniref:SAM-dependent methyltransferase n=1 Tax=Fimbriiglobus ruber TaxID=1908690 RepID=A0A225DZS0_9BACT|nr:class I SAM-dependent methyltransferase [Fimbriiglobus ruber]OWK41875.1 SAM-dependent methyltransferase [Fimbriiglobus ruber]
MQSQNPQAFFDQTRAATYDRQWAKLAPLRDALHLLINAVFADLPAEARILCVGAGTGSELIALAQSFPQWRFTAVEPSAPMLDVCRRRAEECGVAARCEFHEGYLDSLPPADAFDAATSLLVSQFILAREARTAFFRAISARLKPGGYLASSDLASDRNSPAYHSLLEVWLRVMEVSPEKVEQLRAAYGRDVAVLPPAEVSEIIASGGFEAPILFCQTGLIHAWYARRSPADAATARPV